MALTKEQEAERGDNYLADAKSMDSSTPQIDSTSGSRVSSESEKLAHQVVLYDKAREAYAARDAIEAADNLSTSKIVTGTYGPFISGVKGNYKPSQSRIFTSEWGYSYNQKWNENLLALVSGIQKEPDTSYATDFPIVETQFHIPPTLTQSVKNHRFEPSIDSNESAIYANSSSYSYGHKPFIIFSLDNPSLENVDTTIGYRGSSYGAYSGLSLMMVVPNQINANRSATSALTYSIEDQYTSNSKGATRSVTVTIPAQKSVILILIAGEYYYTSYGNIYVMSRELFLSDIDTIFSSPLKIDNNIMVNIDRGFKGLSQFTNLTDLWTATPPVQELTKIENGSLFDYPNNAAAVSAGLTAGQYYIHSSTKAITVVTS